MRAAGDVGYESSYFDDVSIRPGIVKQPWSLHLPQFEDEYTWVTIEGTLADDKTFDMFPNHCWLTSSQCDTSIEAKQHNVEIPYISEYKEMIYSYRWYRYFLSLYKKQTLLSEPLAEFICNTYNTEKCKRSKSQTCLKTITIYLHSGQYEHSTESYIVQEEGNNIIRYECK